MSETLTGVHVTRRREPKNTKARDERAEPVSRIHPRASATDVISEADEPAVDGKWVKGLSPKHSSHQAARVILNSRLTAVSYWLPLAANKSDEDVEYVHQLRVSTRRAAEAIRLFSDFLPTRTSQELRVTLREVRKSADEARNLDVLCAEFLRCTDASCRDTCRQIAQVIAERRRLAQQPIVAVHEKLPAEKSRQRITGILDQLKAKGDKKSKRTFGQQAPCFLKPVLKKFFQASAADLSDDEALHTFRLRTKKLRYTMEPVAAAFASRFKKKLYAEISSLQDLMGAVNDHATARTVFRDWITKTNDDQQKAFFQGILHAELKAHEDLRGALQAIWTPKAAKRLRQQFRDCCGISRL